MIAEAMEEALTEMATRVRRGGWDACLKYFRETFKSAIGAIWTAEIRRRKDLAKAQIEIGQAQQIADSRTANYQQRVTSSATKRAAADGDPIVAAIEAARGRGANPLVLDKFCLPMLRRFTNLKGVAAVEWCCRIADMLADMPEEVLVWAAKNIRDTCKEAFVPPDAVIKDGMEHYLKRKEERGESFTPDDAYPEWDPSSRSRWRHAIIEEADRKSRVNRR
jgi:hypothetical protein